jgi:sterol desaturase/sphingolipid hydroxylase (fatty acid hydroxylase superfamily)
MKPAQCIHEEEVARAARSGDWPAALRAHANDCPVCSEVALVSAFLQTEAESARTEAVLPDASRIWRKAQWASEQAVAERALRPIALMEKLAIACGVLVFAALLWNWQSIFAWFGRIAVLSAPKMAPGSQTNLPFFVATVLFLLLPIFVFGLYLSWSEE